MLVPSGLILGRSLQMMWITWGAEGYDAFSLMLGFNAVAVTLAVPPVELLVAFGSFPERAALLFEIALLAHVTVGAVLLLYVVWRNFAAKAEA